MRKDFIFMMTKDLKLHLLHFNQTLQTVEVISSFQIDMQFGGKGPKEVLHISYDYKTRVIVVVFIQNYVMTVNLEERNGELDDCKCLAHLEIINFTISEFEVNNYVCIQKLRRVNQRNQGLPDYELAILYD